MKINEVKLSQLPMENVSEHVLMTSALLNDFEQLKHLTDYSLTVPIACIVNNDYFSFIEKREECPYIFFLKEKEFEELILTLAKHFIAAKEGALPIELQRSYIVSLLDKMYAFRSLIDQYDGSDSSRESVRFFVHKLAGNTGSYGFLKTSQMCKEMEKEVVAQLLSKNALQTFFTHLLESISDRQVEETPQKGPSPDIKQDKHKLDLMIVDDDSDLTKEIVALVEKGGFTARSWNDFKQAKEEIFDYESHLILVDINSGQELTGYDIMDLFKTNPEKRVGTLIGFLTSSIAVKDKLESIPYSVDIYMEKPLDYDLLFRYLNGLHSITYPQPLRVILLDDDSDFCKQMATSHEEDAVKIFATESVEQFFDSLFKISPHLVLIDYRLQELSGGDIIHLVRDNILYRNLPIILISSHDDPKMFQETFGLDIAGFISKPIAKPLLHKRITEFFKKRSFMHYLEKTDPILGVYSHQELDHLFMTLAPVNKKMALFSLCFEEEISLPDKKQLVKELKTYFPTDAPLGAFDSNSLVLLTTNYSVSRLQLLIDDFLKQEFPSSLTLKVGFAQYPENGNTLDALAKHAKKGENTHVFLTDTLFDQTVFQEKKRSLLISYDQDLKDFITFALFQWNIDVMHCVDGSESLIWIKKHLFKQDPDIIIVDFDLKYENGPVLIEKIGNLVGNRIPITILTGRKEQSILIRSLQQGNVSFVNKPINIKNLTYIVHQALTQ